MTHRRGVAPWSHRRGTAAGPVNGDSEATTRRPGRPRWRSASPGSCPPLGEAAGGSRRFRFPDSRVASPAAPHVLGVAHRPAAGFVPVPWQPPRPRSSPASVRGSSVDSVDGRRASDGEQPRIRSLGDPFHRPVLQGGHHRVLDQILRGGEVPGHLHQRGGQLTRVLSYHAGQLGMRPISCRTHDSSGRISTTGQPGQALTMRSAASRSATSIST
jgi:hypothetical protein